MVYSIYGDKKIVIGTRRSINAAYSFCKRLDVSRNYKIEEYDEELDDYVSVNVARFIYEYENNGIEDFACFQTY